MQLASTHVAGLAAALAFLAAADAASAQPGVPAPAPAAQPGPQVRVGPPGIQRDGFIIGLSIGAGSIGFDCRGCSDDGFGGAAFELHLGGMLSPRLALMFSGSAIAHTEDDATLSSSLSALAAQYWVVDRVWLRGGLGVGRLALSERGYDVESETGAGFLLAGGVELVQTRSFALDASLRGSAVSYDGENVTNASLNIGFNWY